MSEAENAAAATPAVARTTPGRRALKIILWTFGVAAGLCGLLMVIGLLLPSTFAVEQSIVVDAHPHEVHRYVVDLKKWDDWSPWSKNYDADKYAELEFEYEGPRIGEGAIRRWNDPNMPEGFQKGWQKITYADYMDGVRYDLKVGENDEEPMRCEIRYMPVKGGTKVTWTARGDVGLNPFNRWMAVLAKPSFEEDYSAGLERLKGLAEKLSEANRRNPPTEGLEATRVGPGGQPPAPPGGFPGGGPPGGGPPGGFPGQRPPGGFPGGGPPGGGPPGGGRPSFNPQVLVERIMTERDKNKDGKLSKEEMSGGRSQRLFDRADADKDGFITKQELTQAFSRGGGGRRPGGRRPGGRGGSGGDGRPVRPPLEDDDTKKPKQPVPAPKP